MPRILLVEDDLIQSKRFTVMLRRAGYEVALAEDGRLALEQFQQAPCDAVLTDLNLPGLGGVEMIERLHAQYPSVPLIAMTAFGSEELAVQALEAGASTYLPKRSLNHEILDLLEKVLSMARQSRDQERVQSSLTRIELQYALENDDALIMPLVNHLLENIARARLCDARERVRLGVALREAIVNAMEHGNLEGPSEVRGRSEDQYRELLDRRRGMLPYSARRVYVTARISEDEALFIIRDEGPGFDPDSVHNIHAATHLSLAAGRGLILIRTFMDEAAFDDGGRQITMLRRRVRNADSADPLPVALPLERRLAN